MNRITDHAQVPQTSGFWAVMPERKLGLPNDVAKANAIGNRFQEHLRVKTRKSTTPALVRRKRMPRAFTFVEAGRY